MSKPREPWKRHILLFFVSQCISLFGSQIVQMAIVWYVTLETGSGAWVAAFSLCAYLPQFFFSFPGGVWADRFSRKRLIIAADTLIASVTLITLLVMPRIASQPALLFVLLLMSAVRSAGAGIQTPAVSAAVAQLVPQDHLMRYNGVNATMQSLVQFAAPAAAAAVLSVASLRAALAIDVITAMLGVALFSLVHLPREIAAKEASSIRADMALGARYACSCASVRRLLLVYALFIFLTVPAGYLSGLLVSRLYGDTYWYLTAVELAGFGGMMAGGLLMSLWGDFRRRKRTLSAGLLLFGSMAICMGVTCNFALYLCFMALYGVALTTAQTAITTMLQESAERAMHGRVFGLMSALYASCYPIGMALFGPMADTLSLPGIMVFSGIALILLGVTALYGMEDHTVPNA